MALQDPMEMFDSINPGALPSGASAYAGYVGGWWPTYQQVLAMHRGTPVVSIAVNSSEDADALDIESGDASPSQAPTWNKRQMARGLAKPKDYASVSLMGQVLALNASAGVSRSQLLLWTAHYTYKPHLCTQACGLPPGVVADATQWTDRAGNCDESVVTPAFLAEYEAQSTSPFVALVPSRDTKGYLLVRSDGTVETKGDYPVTDGLGIRPTYPVVDAVAVPNGTGTWLAAADGGVFAIGGAPFFGSAGSIKLAAPVVGIEPTPTGKGYWLVAADGGVFCYGDAQMHGSLGGQKLAAAIVGMAATADGKGYWLAGADGGVFSFGETFSGSMGGKTLAKPVVDIVASVDGKGYMMVAQDGGVFDFGDAQFKGSLGGITLAKSISDISFTPDGGGYRMLGLDGGVFDFGSAQFEGAG